MNWAVGINGSPKFSGELTFEGKLEGDTLRARRRIPRDQPGYKVHYSFRSTVYHITIKQTSAIPADSLRIDESKNLAPNGFSRAVNPLAGGGVIRFLNTEGISASNAHTTVKVFQSINAQTEGVDDIFKRDGIYHLRLRFPAEDKIVNIALHGVFTYADALKTFRLFCGWLNARTT